MKKVIVKRTCLVKGCKRKYYSRGLCQFHYQRWARGDKSILIQDPKNKVYRKGIICKTRGCGSLQCVRGFCLHHWRKMRNRERVLAGDVCSVEICNRVAMANGFCQVHYTRVLYGENGLDPTRPIGVMIKKEDKGCKFKGCDRDHYGRGLCAAHHQQRWQGKKLRPIKITYSRDGKICKVNGCTLPVHANMMCCTHNERNHSYGDCYADIPIGLLGATSCKTLREINYLRKLGKQRCICCNRIKQLTSFRKSTEHFQRGNTDPVCRSCHRVHDRNGMLKRKYGMTMNDYKRIFEKQSGVCTLCGRAEKKNKHLSVDHNHTTGVIRGLLCSRCNYQILGAMESGGISVQEISRYLRGFWDLTDTIPRRRKMNAGG